MGVYFEHGGLIGNISAKYGRRSDVRTDLEAGVFMCEKKSKDSTPDEEIPNGEDVVVWIACRLVLVDHQINRITGRRKVGDFEDGVVGIWNP